MRSQLAVRLGAQDPQLLHLPPAVHSLAAAEEAIELADSYLICDGNPLADSQRITLRAACGERVDGSWAAARVGDFGPRQGTGKNDKINARELAGLILFGERLIIHTAHEFPTANESFLRMVAIFDAWDDLRKRVARIRYANGEQGIELLTGQRLKYRARTGGSGRGFAKADLVVYDEAQHLARSHVAASGPAKLANPNSQSWYAGSGGFSTSVVAWEMRRQAILGTGGRLAYTEMTGETIEVADGRIETTPPDPDDRAVWYACIPGLGRWVTEEGVETMRDELGPDFAREGLCVWDPEPSPDDVTRWAVISEDAWHARLRGDASPGEPLAWAVDCSPDGKSSAIACSDGKTVEVVDHRDGTYWVAGRLRDLRDRHHFDEVALDATGPAGSLLSEFAEVGIPYRKVTLQEHAQACGGLLASVCGDSPDLIHRGQPPLDDAVKLADRRHVTDVWLWTRTKSSGDISPLVAVGLARWWAQQQTDGGDFLVV